jgi:hypothetical protein
MLTRDMRRLWADFNEASGDEIWASLRRSPFLGPLENGERVLLWDHEGNRCEAIVREVRGPIVFLTLDGSTWVAAPRRFRFPQLPAPAYEPREATTDLANRYPEDRLTSNVV